mmetsp:Transcript_6631/g.15185  ORF Transcript_6631/g.15185 Transcript_6631/m.15185 type:complete len:337 (+) Transcript_6631:88-1098(+)|eukprot:CAMPEP_0206483244 /NCGR_PEP_ID=MMETSP0324_2-20121206/39315_1 /ASSEMBLY_ACC=CAM_ASM_000836 /TAXON_ID=2866 /ORGANISM="Crypthecodinium cohnii, Strain Seligo" /LENGTH=336 /DNA_ID=CAMNT_0053961267 /DNA_START=91 /DNA_END=1101 /DNA_ORIENTATION=-
MAGLPLPCALAHVLQRSLDLPTEVHLSLAGVGDDRGEVARPPVADLVSDGLSGGLLEGLHHLKDRVALTGAQIVDNASRVQLQNLLQSANVPIGEVHDVDVVAHAGAIDSVIVVAKDRQELPSSHSHLLDERHEVVGHAVGRLTDESGRVGAYGVEVPQDGHFEGRVGLGGVLKELLDHVLRPTIWVAAAQGLLLVDGLLVGEVDRSGGGEDDVVAATLLHRLQDVNRSNEVVLVVPKRLRNALADSFQTREVDDSVEFLGREELIHSLGITHVDSEDWDIDLCDFLNSINGLWARVEKVVHDRDLEAGLQELNHSVGADVAGSASAADVLGHPRD